MLVNRCFGLPLRSVQCFAYCVQNRWSLGLHVSSPMGNRLATLRSHQRFSLSSSWWSIVQASAVRYSGALILHESSWLLGCVRAWVVPGPLVGCGGGLRSRHIMYLAARTRSSTFDNSTMYAFIPRSHAADQGPCMRPSPLPCIAFFPRCVEAPSGPDPPTSTGTTLRNRGLVPFTKLFVPQLLRVRPCALIPAR